jgi:hypothetical protein
MRDALFSEEQKSRRGKSERAKLGQWKTIGEFATLARSSRELPEVEEGIV